MRDLRVKLYPVYPLRYILDRAQRVIGLGCDLKSRRGDRHLIPMAHPHGKVLREISQQGAAADQSDPRSAVFAAIRRLDLPTQEVTYKLQAIADAENRNSKINDPRTAMRGPVFINGVRSAGENYPLWIESEYFLCFHAERMYFAVDA
jgi:hypothetical protein